MLAKLRARVKSTHIIDDIRQETFSRVLQILRSRGGVRHPERLGALVNAVCTNVFREGCRSRRYEEFPAEGLAMSVGDVVDGLISEEQRRTVRRVLGELPESDRRLLRAIFFDEASREEICADLHVDREYLRVRLHRAKEKFRALFERSENQQPTRPLSSRF
ncbi:sigma-70 family RNA polymerase sigma factor [Pendulispora albinea]|uniref:Sigma-70 family RNA polymerase sigma factor n=2 Tax=Pendulispora albinea TaxID=2741071 RepID=A0ABZ2MCX2_9BACT